MNLRKLQKVNAERAIEWHKPAHTEWTGGDWGNAMAGEAGEACNVIKKLRRMECGLKPDDPAVEADLTAELAEELADTLLYLLLVAEHYAIDMTIATRYKFNKVSEREGFAQRI